MHAQRPVLAAIVAALVLAACTEPVPPDKQQPPEPQATELRDATQAPLDKAKAVDAQVEDAARQQRDAIDAQAGG